jgi:hypothetical protein
MASGISLRDRWETENAAVISSPDLISALTIYRQHHQFFVFHKDQSTQNVDVLGIRYLGQGEDHFRDATSQFGCASVEFRSAPEAPVSRSQGVSAAVPRSPDRPLSSALFGRH